MPKRTSAPQNDSQAQLVGAALSILARKKWADITLASVARAAKLSLPEVLALAPSKAALPGLLLRNFASETRGRHRTKPVSGNPRERLFDVALSWFDAQQFHAAALKKLYGKLQYDPATLLTMRGDIVDIAGELLALAEADFGLSPRLQAGIFAGVLVRATSVWRSDDEEMGKTMARLEEDLRRLERLFWPKPPEPAKPPKMRKSKRRR